MPLPAVATGDVGADGTVRGVAATTLLGALHPALLKATTRNE
jgi:hypothetical protein